MLNIKRQCDEQHFAWFFKLWGIGLGRQEAGEEGKWKVVAGEDVGCSACTCYKIPNSNPDAVKQGEAMFAFYSGRLKCMIISGGNNYATHTSGN